MCFRDITVPDEQFEIMPHLQIGKLREGFIAARLDTFIRPVTRVDSADVFQRNDRQGDNY